MRVMRTPQLFSRQSLFLASAIVLASSAAPIGCCCVIPIPASTEEAPSTEISSVETPSMPTRSTAAPS